MYDPTADGITVSQCPCPAWSFQEVSDGMFPQVPFRSETNIVIFFYRIDWSSCGPCGNNGGASGCDPLTGSEVDYWCVLFPPVTDSSAIRYPSS